MIFNNIKAVAANAMALVALFAATISCTKGNDSHIHCIADNSEPRVMGTMLFPSVPDSLWAELELQKGIPSSMSCFLLQADGDNILFDAGLGSPDSQLMPSLEALGLCAEDIDAVFVTHMHGDHVGGLLRGGVAAFPNAKLYINSLEMDSWLSKDEAASAQAKSIAQAYEGRIIKFETGDTLPYEVESIAAYGHTEGHTCYRRGEALFAGDIMHGAALQLKHPEHNAAFDADQSAAYESRVNMLDYARENGLTVYGCHLPEPFYMTSDQL